MPPRTPKVTLVDSHVISGMSDWTGCVVLSKTRAGTYGIWAIVNADDGDGSRDVANFKGLSESGDLIAMVDAAAILAGVHEDLDWNDVLTKIEGFDSALAARLAPVAKKGWTQVAGSGHGPTGIVWDESGRTWRNLLAISRGKKGQFVVRAVREGPAHRGGYDLPPAFCLGVRAGLDSPETLVAALDEGAGMLGVCIDWGLVLERFEKFEKENGYSPSFAARIREGRSTREAREK